MEPDRTDAGADMRRDRPAKGEVIDHVAHDRISGAVAVRLDTERSNAQAILAVLLEAEFLFEAPRAPCVAGAGADIEPVIEGLFDRKRANPPGLVLEHGPAAFAAEVPGTRSAGHGKKPQPRRLCIRPAHGHG